MVLNETEKKEIRDFLLNCKQSGYRGYIRNDNTDGSPSKTFIMNRDLLNLDIITIQMLVCDTNCDFNHVCICAIAGEDLKLDEKNYENELRLLHNVISRRVKGITAVDKPTKVDVGVALDTNL